MNNRGFPSPRPSPGGVGTGVSPLHGIGIGFLNDAIGETEARPKRPRPLKFPRIPYRPPPFRLPYGTNPYFRFGRLAWDIGEAYGPQWFPGKQESWTSVMARNGWTLQCSISELVNQYKYTSCRGGGNSCTTPNEMGDCSVGCGWTGQVPDGPADENGIHVPPEKLGGCGSVGGNWRKDIMYLGYGTDRMVLNQKYERIRLCRCSGTPVEPEPIVIPAPRRTPFHLPDLGVGPLPPIRILPRIKDNPGRETGPKPEPKTAPAPFGPPPPAKPSAPIYGKEKKTRSPWTVALFAVWSAATEVPDWVDAFWDAFPKWFRDRNKGASIDERVLAMLENIELIDPVVAIGNVLYNLGEDALAGKIIGILDSVGVGVGFNGTPFLKNQHTGMWN